MSILLGLFSNRPEDGWSGFGAIASTVSGETVTESSALGVAAYFACVRVLSEDIAKLPLQLFRREGANRMREDRHPVDQLLQRMHPIAGSQSIREAMTAHACTWGNGYAEIERDASGLPIALHIIHPSRVEARRVDGEIIYRVHADSGRAADFWPEDILHIHGLGGTGLSGYSVIRLAAESLGLTIASEKFGAAYFGNGATPGLAIEHPEKLSQAAKENLRDSWVKAHAGAGKSHRPFVLDEGMKVHPYSAPPDDAQFLETRQFQIEEVCRWFRMMPVKIGHKTATPYTNVEALSRAHVDDCLMPWAVRWEQEIQRKLLFEADRASGRYAKHNFSALLRGDAAARANFYRTMINIGAYSPNDVRAKEDEDPIDGGSVYMVQSNMTTLEAVAQGRNLSSQKAAQDQQSGSSQRQQATATLSSVFLGAADRALSKEVRARANEQRKNSGNAKALHQWATAFYGRYRSDIVSAFAPAVDAWCMLADADMSAGMQAIERFADAYCSRAMVAPSSEVADTPTTLADAVLAALQEIPDA